MASGEQKRIVKYKRIVDPSDPDPQNPASYIDVPCITDIWFLSNDGQMYHRTFDSTANNTLRQTHVFTIQNQTQDSSGNVTSDDSDKIDVERIDQIQVQNGDWYEYLNLSNDDGSPSHVRKTHVLRYNQNNKNDANETPWVDVEVVDEFTIQGFLKQTHAFNLGETDASQINIYSLTNDPGVVLNNDDGTDPRSPLWSDNTYWGNLDQLPLDTNGNPDPVRLDPFANIVNINWAAPVGLLCSDGSGMYGSADGMTWKPAPSPVPAIALAWAGNVWIAAGLNSVWRSTDDAKTWQQITGISGTPNGDGCVAGVQPSGKDSNGKPYPPAFILVTKDNARSLQYVYASHDGGKTWAVTLTIDEKAGRPFPGDGLENVGYVNGCGGAFFVNSTWTTSLADGTAALCYVSLDGGKTFTRTQVSQSGLPGPESRNYSNGSVAYDEKTKTYCMTLIKSVSGQIGFVSWSQNFLSFKTSNTPFFDDSDGATFFSSYATSASGGNAVAGAVSAAGGDGAFATGFYVAPDVNVTQFNEYAQWLSGGSQILDSVDGNFNGQPVTSFCFTPGKKTTGATTANPGVFACVSAGPGLAKIWTARASGGWSNTHSGPGIGGGNNVAACVAVGGLSFLK